MLKTREYVREALKDIDFTILRGPLLVVVHYRLPAPLSFPQHKRRKQHLFPHAKRPDGDNLDKFLNDSLSGLIWVDDAQISWMVRSKSLTHAKEGETVIFVRELNNALPNYEVILSEINQHIEIEAPNVESINH